MNQIVKEGCMALFAVTIGMLAIANKRVPHDVEARGTSEDPLHVQSEKSKATVAKWDRAFSAPAK